MIAWRLSSSFGWIRSSAIPSPSSLRFRLIRNVVSVVSGPRKSLSNSGRTKGSKRRWTWTRTSPTRAIRSSRTLPVSGGGSPKPGPGFAGCRVGSLTSVAAAASRATILLRRRRDGNLAALLAAAAKEEHAHEQQQGLDDGDREPVDHDRAERDRLADDREQQPVHRRLPDAEARGGEDREHGDDRAHRGRAAEERDRRERRVAADRAQHEEEGGAAERPGERVEAEQLERRPRGDRRHRLRAERAQQPARDRREHGRVEQERDEDAEGAERQQRHVGAADDHEPDEEDTDAGDGGEPRLEQDR